MSRYQGMALVRDKDGNPKVDDPSGLPPEMIMMLTQSEKEGFGLWTGPLARDAEGVKRLEVVEGGYKAVDDLVAANVLYALDGTIHRISPRARLLAGQILGVS